jgi:hypothetical protein
MRAVCPLRKPRGGLHAETFHILFRRFSINLKGLATRSPSAPWREICEVLKFFEYKMYFISAMLIYTIIYLIVIFIPIFKFLYCISVVLGVPCYIYKSAYNIS